MTALSLIAPAKLNLFLHVTGKRVGGYHLLESLVAFTEFGDAITVAPAPQLQLTISGEFADTLPVENNLVLRAARQLQKNSGMPSGAHINLHKNIPIGAGLGGGSADAAAALRGLSQLWNLSLAGMDFSHLGSDIPACLGAQPALVEGVGEIITPASVPGGLWALLVNPRRPLLTADVYRAYDGPYSSPQGWRPGASIPDFIAALKARHNALEAPARALMPVIGDMLLALGKTEGCLLARMSGSGATCFGLYASEREAQAAAEHMRPWWCVATKLLTSPHS